MTPTRRETLTLGAGAGLATVLPYRALAATGASHSHETASGEITVHPVSHASFVMETPGPVIYADPVGGAGAYAGLPAPGLILLTHRHGDHYDVPTLEALAGDGVEIVANRDVHDLMPGSLRERTRVLGHDGSLEIGGIGIGAIPAYNFTEGRLNYHPRSRGDNGYVLGIDGRRVYIAGDTEDTPEMRALEGIDIAFVPMNLPYTMAPGQAAAGVAAFRPAVVYPYHHRGSDLDAFEDGLAGAEGTRVIRAAWYG